MNNWQYHDNKILELQKIYLKTSKQTQNRLQELLSTFDFTYDTLYDIVDNKTKNRINTYILEWKEKGLLIGYFGVLAKNIYAKTRVKNSEILELLIYSAYIEEQSKLQETELNIFKEDTNYYYQQGQNEVNQTLKNKKKMSIIPDAIFLALMDMASYNNLTWQQYIQTIIQYNTQQIYKQVITDLQQQKELEINSSEYQNIINNQIRQKVNINNEKISGATDLQLIGLNNLAKVEGIKSIDKNAKIRFIAISDENSTDMCQSMNNMEFYIDKENIFDRYWGETKKELKLMRVKVKGLVLGINLPPIMHHFHYCRSWIMYLPPVENKKETEYNTVDYIRNNKYTNSKNLDSNIKRALRKLPQKIIELLKDTKFIISNKNSYYNRKDDEIHLLEDSDEYEILHEIGHVIETKLDILRDEKFIDIQKSELENINLITDLQTLKEYQNINFVKNTGKFISDYQRRVYEYDIDNNYLINYNTYAFNERTLGEYFSEGFRCYFKENKLLKRKDINLYNYIKEVLT